MSASARFPDPSPAVRAPDGPGPRWLTPLGRARCLLARLICGDLRAGGRRAGS